MVKKNLLTFIIILFSFQLFAQNNCLDFDGSHDYISIPNSSLLTDLTAFTIEAWINTPSSASMKIVGKTDSIHSDGFVVGTINNTLYCELWDGSVSGLSATSTATYSSNSWAHLALSWSNNGSFIGYINGVEVFNVLAAGYSNLDNTNAMIIGSAPWDHSSYFYNGKVDEVRFWNDVRSEAEIRQCMYREIPVPSTEANLVAYYKFNETSGGIASDSKGSNDGTLYPDSGDNQFSFGDNAEVSAAIFGPKDCLDFDGSGDYVSCGSMNLSGSSITLECWVNVDVFQSTSPYISSIIGTETNGSALLRFGDSGLAMNKVQFVLDIGGQTKLDGVTEFDTDKWYHIAGVYDNSEMKIYINGKLDASKEQTGEITSNGPFYIASNIGSERYLDGSIDEVRVWSDARTATEIRDNMCKNLTGNEINLLSYYNCDLLVSTKLPDYAGNNDGTKSGNTYVTTSSVFNTWLNTSSSSWSIASNWSLDSIPSNTEPFDNIGIYSYTGGADLDIDYSEPGANHMVLGSNSSVTLSYGLGLTGNLILESDLDLNGEVVFLMDNSTLIEDNGRVYGTSGYIFTQRQLSNISENVAGLGAEITEDGDLGSCTITRGAQAQGTLGIDRYFQITTTNSPSSATLVFHYSDSELNGVTESDLALFKSSDGTSWTEQTSATLDTDNNTLTLTGIDEFSYWTAAETGSGPTLPVGLSVFTADFINNTPTLYWETQSEVDNLGWNIYRNAKEEYSSSLLLTEEMIPGSGTTTEPSYYHFEDVNDLEIGQTYYYWLESIDYGGVSQVYSRIAEITIPDPSTNPPNVEPPILYDCKNAPNPVNGSTTFSFTLDKSSMVSVSVYNIKGELIRELSPVMTEPDITSQIYWNGKDKEGNDLTPGVYFYNLMVNGKTESTQKLIMIK